MTPLNLKNGLSRLAQQDYKGVHAECIAAITADVTAAVPYFLLGVIAFEHKNFGKALELFGKAADLGPQEAYYPAYTAMTLSTLRRSNEARIVADTASKLARKDPHLRDMIGVIYSRCGFHEKAVQHFMAATAANDREPNYFFNLAASQQFLGRFEEAEMAYNQTLRLDTSNYRAWSSLTSLKKQTPQRNNLSQLKRLFDAPDNSHDTKLHLGHAIAKTLEDLGHHEESLDWLLQAKAGKRAEFPFDRDSAAALFEAAKRTSNAPKTQNNTPQDTTPIFIVGLPRTGTTLVDRIISSHSAVTSAGELNAFAEQIKILAGTKTPYVLDAETLNAAPVLGAAKAGQAYLAQTSALAASAPYMIDKMPLNFFYAALMTRAFPKVKIIALRRGAMDSCLSNFRQLFSTQFSYYNYTFDLEDTAFFYRQFDALMEHWRGTLPSEQFMEVSYEDIVHDQENQTQALLDFCGLPWEDACMRFHENTAAVSTASSVQVRQPLYSGSIGRWKKYGQKLDVLRAALGHLAD